MIRAAMATAGLAVGSEFERHPAGANWSDRFRKGRQLARLCLQTDRDGLG